MTLALVFPSEWEILLWTLKQTFFSLYAYTFSVWECVCLYISKLIYICFYFCISSILLHYFSFTICLMKQNGIWFYESHLHVVCQALVPCFAGVWVLDTYIDTYSYIYSYIKSNNTYIIAHRERMRFIQQFITDFVSEKEKEMILPPAMTLIFSWRELSDGLWFFLSNCVKEFVSHFWQRKNENC